MLFLQFMLYSSSFVGTLVKNEIPEAALELCQLNINQLSPDILKFRTKHEDNQDNLFTLNCFVVSCSFFLYFMQARVDWVLITFGTQVIKKKRPVRPVFPDYPFLMTMVKSKFSVDNMIHSLQIDTLPLTSTQIKSETLKDKRLVNDQINSK